jgi:hypothetical protein
MSPPLIAWLAVGAFAVACVGFEVGSWWRARSNAENDARLSAGLVHMGEAIAEALILDQQQGTPP